MTTSLLEGVNTHNDNNVRKRSSYRFWYDLIGKGASWRVCVAVHERIDHLRGYHSFVNSSYSYESLKLAARDCSINIQEEQP